ncbi:hypothetical protein AB0442_22035 [Kitasatospora sp. NPDC085895]|uniref:hypothetical protein n=1 Tax=Kitasatospora sp. NPDC085895 TaxID=3155057 RepID=UPI00344B9227
MLSCTRYAGSALLALAVSFGVLAGSAQAAPGHRPSPTAGTAAVTATVSAEIDTALGTVLPAIEHGARLPKVVLNDDIRWD